MSECALGHCFICFLRLGKQMKNNRLDSVLRLLLLLLFFLLHLLQLVLTHQILQFEVRLRRE